MKILVASDSIVVRSAGGYKNFITRQALTYWNDERARPQWEIDGAPISARIISSKWAVKCECGETCTIEPGQPWFCWYCLNMKNGGKARMVVWPDNRSEIESVLLKRFRPDERNWTAETIEELRQENIEHGDEV